MRPYYFSFYSVPLKECRNCLFESAVDHTQCSVLLKVSLPKMLVFAFFFPPSEVLDSTASIQKNIVEHYDLKDKFSSPLLKDTLMWKASIENT